MNMPNPYLAPQASLVQNRPPTPAAKVSPLMQPVARGLGLVLRSLILLLAALVFQFGVMFWIMSMPVGSISKPDLLALGVGVALISGFITIAADGLNMWGFARCAKTMFGSVRWLAQMAMLTTAGGIVCRCVSIVMQMNGIFKTKSPGPLPSILELCAAVLGLIAFIAFLAYLRKTAVQLADPRAMLLSKLLLRICYALVAFVVAATVIVLAADIGPVQMPRSRLFIICVAITGIGVIVMYTYYAKTIRQIRRVIQVGIVVA